MNASSKILFGAVAIVMASIVACGGSRSNGGGGSGGGGFGCVQVGATCVQTAPGFVGQGTWVSDRDNSTFRTADVTVTLKTNQGFGGFQGGYYGIPGAQQQPTQTIASVVIRYANGTLRGQGVANGGTQGFSVTLLGANGQPHIVNGANVILNGQFLDQTQTVMNYQIVGALPASGRLVRRGGQQNPIGYGSGGYGFGGAWGRDQVPYGFDSTSMSPDEEYARGYLGLGL